jgi:predicted amidophosphoribosyltransferase
MLPDREVERIEGFLRFFERAVCLGINKHLGKEFSDELDFCLALDFGKPSPTADRTVIGELEYQAKYHQDSEAIGELGRELAIAVRSLPRDAIPRPRLLTFVPSDRRQRFCLPALLARGIVDMVPKTFWDDQPSLVTSSLTVPKSAAKGLSVDQKIVQWKKLLQSDAIALSRPVANCSVIVVDDLYQSGVSLWSFAKYLKSQQARCVVGLTCVKSLRDTDNR